MQSRRDLDLVVVVVTRQTQAPITAKSKATWRGRPLTSIRTIIELVSPPPPPLARRLELRHRSGINYAINPAAGS